MITLKYVFFYSIFFYCFLFFFLLYLFSIVLYYDFTFVQLLQAQSW